MGEVEVHRNIQLEHQPQAFNLQLINNAFQGFREQFAETANLILANQNEIGDRIIQNQIANNETLMAHNDERFRTMEQKMIKILQKKTTNASTTGPFLPMLFIIVIMAINCFLLFSVTFVQFTEDEITESCKTTETNEGQTLFSRILSSMVNWFNGNNITNLNCKIIENISGKQLKLWFGKLTMTPEGFIVSLFIASTVGIGFLTVVLHHSTNSQSIKFISCIVTLYIASYTALKAFELTWWMNLIGGGLTIILPIIYKSYLS